MNNKVTEYIKLANRVSGTRLFCFINLKSYLDHKDYQLLYDTLKYEELVLLDISNSNDYVNSFEKCFVIDKDMCIIEVN